MVDKSLAVYSRDAGRWQLLDTVRAFARELLEADQARSGVLGSYLDWARSAATGLVSRLGEHQWRPDFDTIAADLRAALLNCPPGAGPAGHELARALARLAFARRFFADSLRYFQQAADRATDPAEAARDLWSAAHCALILPTPGRQVLELLHGTAERARAAGDGDLRAIALARVVEVVYRFDGRISSDVTTGHLRELLDEAHAAGDPGVPAVRAAIAVAEAWNATGRRFDPDRELAGPAADATRATGDPVQVSSGLDVLGTVAAKAGDHQWAHRVSRERFALLPLLDRTDPVAALEIEDIFDMAATTALRAGDLTATLDVARRMVDDDLLGHRSRNTAGTLVSALLLAGEHAEALRHADELWAGWERAGRPAIGQVVSGAAFAMLGHGLLGDREAQLRWRSRIWEIADSAGIDASGLASVVFTEARLAIHHGETAAAADLAGRAAAGFPAYRFDAYAQAAGAELAVLAGLPDASERVAAATAATAGNAWAQACLARARGRLHEDTGALADAVARWTEVGARFERAYTLTLLPDRADEGRAELAELGVPSTHG